MTRSDDKAKRAKARHTVNYEVLAHVCRRMSDIQRERDPLGAGLASLFSDKSNHECICTEWITTKEAKLRVQQGRAEWMRAYSPTGEPYEYRRAIVMTSGSKTPRARAIEMAHLEHSFAQHRSDARVAITKSWGNVTHADQAVINAVAQHAALPMQEFFDERCEEAIRQYWEDYRMSMLEARLAICAPFIPDPFSGRPILIFRMDD